MGYTYSRSASNEELYASQAKATRSQLEKLDHEIKVLRDAAAADPYLTPPRLKLPPLLQLRNKLESQLKAQEGAAGISKRDTTDTFADHTIAPSGFWRGENG